MANKTTNVDMVLDEVILETREYLRELKPGDDGYKEAITALTQLSNAKTNEKKVEVQKADNEAQMVEKVRMNNEQLDIDRAKLAMEYERMEADRELKERQYKLNWKQILIGSAIDTIDRGLTHFDYSMAFNKAYTAEYGLSDGNSQIPPSTVTRPLEKLLPKRK